MIEHAPTHEAVAYPWIQLCVKILEHCDSNNDFER